MVNFIGSRAARENCQETLYDSALTLRMACHDGVAQRMHQADVVTLEDHETAIGAHSGGATRTWEEQAGHTFELATPLAPVMPWTVDLQGHQSEVVDAARVQAQWPEDTWVSYDLPLYHSMRWDHA